MTRIVEGRTAVVTGAASGIGLACATALAAAGAKVRVLDIDADRAEQVAAEIGGEARVVDLTEPRNGVHLAEDADILVNNAGFQVVRPLEEFPPDTFHQMLALMVEAPFQLIRTALPHMYAQNWGRIVNVSSVHGLRASAYKAGYVTAKHALEGLSKVAAVEGGPHGVTSNCVNPGYVRTPLVSAASSRRRRLPMRPRITSTTTASGTRGRSTAPYTTRDSSRSSASRYSRAAR